MTRRKASILPPGSPLGGAVWRRTVPSTVHARYATLNVTTAIIAARIMSHASCCDLLSYGLTIYRVIICTHGGMHNARNKIEMQNNSGLRMYGLESISAGWVAGGGSWYILFVPDNKERIRVLNEG